jgi:hypothetical protein
MNSRMTSKMSLSYTIYCTRYSQYYTNDNLSISVMAYGYSTSLIIVLCAVMGICFIYRENRSSRRKLPPSLKTYQHVTTTEIKLIAIIVIYIDLSLYDWWKEILSCDDNEFR